MAKPPVKKMSEVSTDKKQIEDAKRLLEKIEKERQEKLTSLNTTINNLLNENKCGISTTLTAEVWLELGKRFMQGEKVVHLQPSIFAQE